jgi:hypothetical protein
MDCVSAESEVFVGVIRWSRLDDDGRAASSRTKVRSAAVMQQALDSRCVLGLGLGLGCHLGGAAQAASRRGFWASLALQVQRNGCFSSRFQQRMKPRMRRR